MGTAAIALGSAALLNCRAVEIPGDGGNAIEAGVFAYKTKGAFTTDDAIYIVDVCRSYTDIRDDFGFDYDEDNWMPTLERIAYTIPILGGIALIRNCVNLCGFALIHPFIWKLYGLIYVCCCILQGIGLKIMDSYICTNNPLVQYLDEEFPAIGSQFQDDCEKNQGMRMGISATVFWGIAGLACIALAAPETTDESPGDAAGEQEDKQ